MPFPGVDFKSINVLDVRRTLAGRNYKNYELSEIDGEPIIKARWTQTETAAFCAEFGVSASPSRDGFVICNLQQPYQPRTKFAVSAQTLAGWNDFNLDVPPPQGVWLRVCGDYTAPTVSYPYAIWDGFNWQSTEWRGSVAIRFYRRDT